MLGLIRGYMRWLHTGWPAGTVEKLPEVNQDGSTNVPGLYVVGDLTGIPLLKFSADSGARAVQTIVADGAFQTLRGEGGDDSSDVLDLVIIGGGISGMAAALEAKKSGLRFELLEASEPFSTIVNFPKGKPIYTYPTEMTPAGELQFTAQVKEPLVAEVKEQTQGIEPRIARVEHVERDGKLLKVLVAGAEPLRARRVIVGIGRSGNFRKLGVPGEERDKVSNRLHDPKDFTGKDVLVVGGGDSALEAAIALAQCGARVALSYRKPEFSRPKPDNVEKLNALVADPSADVSIEEPTSERVTTATGRFVKDHVVGQEPGSLTLYMGSTVAAIEDEAVTLETADGEQTLPNDEVFAMIGREAPLDIFRRSGVKIRAEIRGAAWPAFLSFLLLFVVIYVWKTNGTPLHPGPETFPQTVPTIIAGWGAGWAAAIADRTTLLGTIAVSMKSPSFYYTLTYCLLILVFGIRRIRRRQTPYVTAQTTTLFFVQLIPLFLLPEIILPYAGYNGAFGSGVLEVVSKELFPLYGGQTDAGPWPTWGHPRAYWHMYGLILAWPLFIYNVFASQPMVGWLILSFVQTFVIIPLIVWRWGKGAYCGWICSCGGLAETMGDAHRHKMPHGPGWNRLNMVGQGILLLCFLFLGIRILGWAGVGWANTVFTLGVEGKTAKGGINLLSYKWIVDIGLAGVIGIGAYFWFSGRTWCRFACPLAALMHIYARFSQFRILSDKKKCISCNVCTSVCHQGIDVMNFANKGLPMEDPECVRCSACVQSCPTGVLEFGRIDRKSGDVLGLDRLGASPVRMRERGKSLPVVTDTMRLGGGG